MKLSTGLLALAISSSIAGSADVFRLEICAKEGHQCENEGKVECGGKSYFTCQDSKWVVTTCQQGLVCNQGLVDAGVDACDALDSVDTNVGDKPKCDPNSSAQESSSSALPLTTSTRFSSASTPFPSPSASPSPSELTTLTSTKFTPVSTSASFRNTATKTITRYETITGYPVATNSPNPSASTQSGVSSASSGADSSPSVSPSPSASQNESLTISPTPAPTTAALLQSNHQPQDGVSSETTVVAQGAAFKPHANSAFSFVMFMLSVGMVL